MFSDRREYKQVGASRGWLRFNDREIPAARRDWKFGKRDREPEKEEYNKEKLHKRMKAQLHAGAVPTVSCRRPSIATRANRLMAQKLKLKKKEERVTAALREARAKAKAGAA